VRVIKAFFYTIYLYLFFQRIYFVIKYFKSMTGEYFGLFFSVVTRITGTRGQQPLQGKKQMPPPVSLLKRLVFRIFKSMMFLYNSFILVQLCAIGYAESLRFNQKYQEIVASVKRVRIRDQADQ